MPTDPSDKIEFVDGVELDYGSNELAGVLRGVIKGNGNYLERLLGDLVLGGDPELLAEARTVVAPLLSRRVAKHYGGFATSQLKAFDDKPSAKRALYVLRTAATGRHLLAHGEVVTDVARLGAFVPPEIEELLAIKRGGERHQLEAAHATVWRDRLVAAIAAVDAAVATSVLPAEPPDEAIAELEAWLVGVRRRFWA
jgi:predicted nucleotidyltransferase